MQTFIICLVLQTQGRICVNYKPIPRREYVVLGNNDIISLVPGGSVDYRYVTGGIPQGGRSLMDVNTSQQLLPVVRNLKLSEATTETHSSAGRATHFSNCVERLAKLEAEILELTTKKEKLQYEVGLANSQVEQPFHHQLMTLLEEAMNCAICSDILIEIRR